MAGFLPSANGLHFDNDFPDGPALTVDLGVTSVPVGNAANGLCGGMVFAALDYWSQGRPPPTVTAPPASGTPLFRYLVRRLIDSWGIPQGPLTYLALMNPTYPDGDTGVGPLTVHGRAWRMVNKEWPAIQATLDAGQPCPLGLVRLISANPLDIGKNHQVLAYGYELSGSALRLAVYDPNQADRDDVTLALDVGDPTRPTPVTMSATDPDASGLVCFFKVGYTAKTPPPGPFGHDESR
jgi:hypothetical protein